MTAKVLVVHRVLTRVKKQWRSATLRTKGEPVAVTDVVTMAMSQSTHIELVEQLSRNSRPYRDPLARIDWEHLDRDSYWLPESALSLHGVDSFEALPEPIHRALSQQEYLHFAGIDTWIKGLFMERLSHSMQSAGGNTALTRYRLHELREQAGHALMFLELQKRAVTVPYRNPAVSSRIVALMTRYTPIDSLTYQLLMLIGSELPDRLNRMLRLHRSEICPAVYDMVNLQIMDATRHITQARDAVDIRTATTATSPTLDACPGPTRLPTYRCTYFLSTRGSLRTRRPQTRPAMATGGKGQRRTPPLHHRLYRAYAPPAGAIRIYSGLVVTEYDPAPARLTTDCLPRGRESPRGYLRFCSEL